MRFGLELDNTDTATVRLGNSDQNYISDLIIEDGDDGFINVIINKFLTGRQDPFVEEFDSGDERYSPLTGFDDGDLDPGAGNGRP